MKILKINKTTYLKAVGIIAFSGLLLACKRQEILKYSGENVIYFINKDRHMTDHLGTFSGFTDNIKISFLVSGYQVDTFQMNYAKINYYFMPLTIQLEGKLASTNRKIAIGIEGDGTAFCVLPHPDSIYIPANGSAYKLNLKIARPPQNDTTLKTITLTLKSNDAFAPQKLNMHRLTYQFGNCSEMPDFYETHVFGAFSGAKMRAIQMAVFKAGPSVWATDVNAISLNTHLLSVQERKVAFDNFTLEVLYHFFDIRRHAVSGVIRNNYNAIATKIKSITQAYLQAMNDAGSPVKDDAGIPVSIP